MRLALNKVRTLNFNAMQPVTNCTVIQDDALSINCLQPVFNNDRQTSKLDALLGRVKLGDIIAFEALR